MLRFLIVASFLSITQASLDLPPGIKTCPKTKDADAFARCTKNVFDELVPFLSKGIPAINVPSLEPLTFPIIEANRNLGLLNVDLHFTNFKLYGLTNSTITDYKVNYNNITLKLKAKVPKLAVAGDYNIEGKLFFVPLGGIGSFTGIVRDVSYMIRAHGKIIQNKNGTSYIKLDFFRMTFKIDNGRVNLKSPLQYALIASAMQQVFNTNSAAVMKIAKPLIDDVASDLTGNIMQNILNVFNKEELIPS